MNGRTGCDVIIEQIMRVAMATLRAMTARHCHTDRVHVLTQLANKTCKACKTPYETPQSIVALKGC